MNRKTKYLLIAALGVIFFVGSAGAILYAEGYRVDFATLSFKKVGALYVRSFPANADIILDGKPKSRGWQLFQSGTFVNNLFPSNYVVELVAAGYRPWQRQVAVEPSEVTDLSYAVLLPSEPISVATTSAPRFWLVNDQPLLTSPTGTLLFAQQALRGAEPVAWTVSGRTLLAHDRRTDTYFLNDLAAGTSTNLTSLARRANGRAPREILMDPSNGALLAVGTTTLGLLDSNLGTLSAIATTTATTTADRAAISRAWVVWTNWNAASGTSRMNTYDRFAGNLQFGSPAAAGRTVRLDWIDVNRLAALQNDGSLYAYNVPARQLEKTASDVRDFALSGDGALVAALGHRSLEIIPYGDRRDYRRFNLADIGSVENIEWYRDNHHLLVHYPDRVVFLDLDDPSPQDAVTLIATTEGHYGAGTNEFYYLADGKLLKYVFP
jgi:hypothetical protein